VYKHITYGVETSLQDPELVVNSALIAKGKFNVLEIINAS